MESWRKTFREGIAPQLSTAGMQALATALQTDDARLLQGTTTSPPALQAVYGWSLEGADAIGYCGWHGDGLSTVAEAEEFFGKVCYECDQVIGEPAACRWWLNWYDDTTRNEMRRELLPEVLRVLGQREAPTKEYASMCSQNVPSAVMADYAEDHGWEELASAWKGVVHA